MNSLIKCSATLALATLVLLFAVSSVEKATSARIAQSRQHHKQTVLNQLLEHIKYDHLVNLPLWSEKAVNITPTISLLSMQAVITYQQQSAVLLEIATTEGYNGLIKLLVVIDANGVIKGVRVIEHHETPGLGDKIEASRSVWIGSFVNQSLQNPSSNQWQVKRDGGQFDQFTGATITPRAVVKAIHAILTFAHAHAHHQQFFPQPQTPSTVTTQ